MPLDLPSAYVQPAQTIGAAPYVVMVSGQGLDIASTIDAKRRGLREANPIIGQRSTWLIASKAGAAIVAAMVMRTLDRRGHDRAARWLGYVSGIGVGVVGARNYATGRHGSR